MLREKEIQGVSAVQGRQGDMLGAQILNAWRMEAVKTLNLAVTFGWNRRAVARARHPGQARSGGYSCLAVLLCMAPGYARAQSSSGPLRTTKPASFLIIRTLGDHENRKFSNQAI